MGIIRTTYEIITEESAAEGDVAESGYLDEEGTEYDVGEAIYLLEGCEPSASFFHVGIWYTMYGEQDSHTGEYENVSYHLSRGERSSEKEPHALTSGWTEEEERRIYEGVTRKGVRECVSVSDNDERLQ